MDDPWIFVFVLGLPLLFLLLTGPGLWSEKWGWGFFGRKRKQRRVPRTTPIVSTAPTRGPR